MPSSATPAAGAATHYARLSDGRSASATDATVRLALHGLEIMPEGGGARRVWRYDSIRSGEPLRRNAIDVLLSSTTDPGATVFVPGPAFAAALATYAPQLTAKAERWRSTRPWLMFAGILVAATAAVYASGWSPAHAIAQLLPESWRQRLGDEARTSMTEGYKQCGAESGIAALDKLSQRLARGAGMEKPFAVTVYDWSLMNAFAVPGGHIVLTRGLIEKAQSPDEVAGVLAHEMGHGIKLHPETGIIRTIGLAAALEMMMGGSGGALANLGLMLAQIGYTRAAEREADLVGLQVLKGSGVAPQGLADFFKRIEKVEADSSDASKTLQPFSILRTHPPTAERAALVKAQPTYPATPALDAQSWQDLKSVCSRLIEPEKPDREASAN